MLTELDRLHEISVNEMQMWLQLSHSSWVEHVSSTGDRTLFSLEYRVLIECPFHQNHGMKIFTVSCATRF